MIFLVEPISILDVYMGPGCGCQNPDSDNGCVGIDTP